MSPQRPLSRDFAAAAQIKIHRGWISYISMGMTFFASAGEATDQGGSIAMNWFCLKLFDAYQIRN